jgi:hypothetical protein
MVLKSLSLISCPNNSYPCGWRLRHGNRSYFYKTSNGLLDTDMVLPAKLEPLSSSDALRHSAGRDIRTIAISGPGNIWMLITLP